MSYDIEITYDFGEKCSVCEIHGDVVTMDYGAYTSDEEQDFVSVGICICSLCLKKFSSEIAERVKEAQEEEGD